MEIKLQLKPGDNAFYMYMNKICEGEIVCIKTYSILNPFEIVKTKILYIVKTPPGNNPSVLELGLDKIFESKEALILSL